MYHFIFLSIQFFCYIFCLLYLLWDEIEKKFILRLKADSVEGYLKDEEMVIMLLGTNISHF